MGGWWSLAASWGLTGTGCCFAAEPGALKRYAMPLSPFEIGMILDWVGEWPVHMEADAVVRKLKGAVDTPIHDWAENWQDHMDQETALAKLHAALNPVVLEFTLPEMKSMVHWSNPDRHNNYGIGGNFQLSEEKILLEKLNRMIDRAKGQ